MIINIDSREIELLKFCQLLNTDTEISLVNLQLNLGDLIINNQVIIERKTLTDLASSIRDGRYKEQSFRLQKALEEGFKVIYMIEGNIDLYVGNVPKETLVRTFYSLMNKGFNVFLTKNVKESAYFIIQFSEKIKTQKTTNLGNYEDIEGIVHKQKNTNLTRDNISIFMLSQLPGISNVTATVIMDKYKHISKLIKDLDVNPNCLEEFEYINPKNNKPKKLNKNVIKCIKDFL
jgi:DNA excision repair protein ERCC-4